ncbi:hypothetical protein B0H12DRAFT_125078 [Mycena haematopus]|nr:hypothetical protein B0H12DRAFT_125078 [Mycena haematopus]
MSSGPHVEHQRPSFPLLSEVCSLSRTQEMCCSCSIHALSKLLVVTLTSLALLPPGDASESVTHAPVLPAQHVPLPASTAAMSPRIRGRTTRKSVHRPPC